MPRNLGFYNRKMNWTFQFILVQVHSTSELSSVQVLSAKKWTKFSSKFTKKVNNWTELNFSVQFSHFLAEKFRGKLRYSDWFNNNSNSFLREIQNMSPFLVGSGPWNIRRSYLSLWWNMSLLPNCSKQYFLLQKPFNLQMS